jgi:hypothetical protein
MIHSSPLSYLLQGHFSIKNRNSVSTGGSFQYCGRALAHSMNMAIELLREGGGSGRQTSFGAFGPECAAS